MGINEPSQVLCLGIGNCWRLIKVGHWENRVIFWPQRSMVPFRWRATCQEIQKSKWAWMMTLALGMLALAAMVSTLLLIDWWNRSDCGNVTWLGADKLYNYHMRYFSKKMCGIVYVNVSRFWRSLLWSIRRIPLLKDCCPDLAVQLQNMVQEVEWVWSFWMTAISMNQSAWMTLNWIAHLLWYLSTLRSRVPLKVVLEIKLPEKSQVSGFDNERKGFVVRTCCSNRTDATVGHQKSLACLELISWLIFCFPIH